MSDVVLIIPLLIAIGMVVGQGAGGRKQGRGSFDQEVKHHLLLRHTPQNPTTFPYIPSYIFHFEQNTTVHNARAVGWERGIVLSLWRAGQSYTRLTIPSHNPAQFYTNPSPICMSRNPTALCRNPTFPCNSPQIWQNLLKNPPFS